MGTFGRGLQIFNNAPGGGGYVLPIASETILGGIKVGDGLSIDGTGVLSVDPPVVPFVPNAENGLYIAEDGITVRMGINPLIEDTDIDIRLGHTFSIRNTMASEGPVIAAKQLGIAGTMTFSLQNANFGGVTCGMGVDGDVNGTGSKWGVGVSSAFTFEKGLQWSTNPAFLPDGIYVKDDPSNIGLTSQEDFMRNGSPGSGPAFKVDKLQFLQRSGALVFLQQLEVLNNTGAGQLLQFELLAPDNWYLQINLSLTVTAFVDPVILSITFNDLNGNPATLVLATGGALGPAISNSISVAHMGTAPGTPITVDVATAASSYSVAGAICWLNPIP